MESHLKSDQKTIQLLNINRQALLCGKIRLNHKTKIITIKS